MEIQLLRSKFVADTRDLDRGYRHAEERARLYARNVNHELDQIGRTSGRSGGIFPGLANISEIIQGIPQVGRLIGGLVSPFTDAAEAGVRYNMMLENAMVNYEGLTGSMDKARERLAVLQSFAERKTPFEFPGVLKATQYMNTFGFALDEQIPKLTAWGNAVAASGDISEEVLQGVVRAFGQIRAKGRVQAEEMEQLAERGIPAWELLAKAIGKTEAETRKLAETGRLKGREAVEAITAMINVDPRYAGQMERMMDTFQGRLSTLNDIRDRAQGVAAQSLTSDLSETLDAALKKGDLATTLATYINSAITPASGLIKVSLKTVLGGGVSAGLTEAFQAAESVLPGVVQQMLQKGVLGPAMDVLGIHSPSRVFHEYGVLCALGLQEGLQEGFQGTFESDKRVIQRNLDRLGQSFKDKVAEIARQLRTNPDWLLNVMAFETGGSFNPRAHNPLSGATGLIQFMPSTARGLGTSTDQLSQMSALKQLDYVLSYLRPFAGRLNSQSDVYSAVLAPGGVGASDDATLYRRGTREYRDNNGLDLDRSGTISKGEAAARVSTMGFGNVSRANPLPVEIVDHGIPLNAPLQPDYNALDAVSAPTEEIPAAWAEALDSVSKMKISLHEMQPLIPIDATNRLGDAALESAMNFDQAGASAEDWASKVIAASNIADERLKDVQQDIRAGFEDAFGGGLMDLMQGKGKEVGLNFLQSFLGTIEQNLARSISQRLGDVVFGEDGSGGVLGGVFDNIFSKVLGVKKKDGSSTSILSGRTTRRRGGRSGSSISDSAKSINQTVERSGKGVEATVANEGTRMVSSVQALEATMERLLASHEKGFWGGLLDAVISGATNGAISSINLGGGHGGNAPNARTDAGVPFYRPPGNPTLKGGHADGGPFGPDEFFEINERGPEMIDFGDNRYFYTGNTSGNVISNEKLGGPQVSLAPGAIQINIHNGQPNAQHGNGVLPQMNRQRIAGALTDAVMEELDRRGVR
jgi:tape measure domain-containing protein